MSIWWVNHKQTYRHERNGGYIWSPKTKSNGNSSHYYDNMARVRARDLVVSFASAKVSAIGAARSSASNTARPTAYNKIGNNWDSIEGWLIPIEWVSLEQSVRPQDIIGELRPHLPDLHSPVRPANGKGNQGMYLTSISEGVLDVILSNASPNDRLTVEKLQRSSYSEDPDHTAEDIIEKAIRNDENLDTTEKESLSKARRGQGIFKDRLQEIEEGCRLTGVTNERFLIASHILAWKSCTTSQQRLDGANGLLLTPNADRLFDRGMISFKDDGEVLVKDEISDHDLSRLGLPSLRGRNAGAFTPEQQAYLKFHRELNGF